MRCADRRRRLCRPGAGHRAAPGARRSVCRSRSPIRRSGRASRAMRAPRRSRRRRGGCSRPSASGSKVAGWRAADPRHGRHRYPSLQDAVRPMFLTFGGEVAPGEPFAHMIENAAAARCAGRAGEGGRRRASRRRRSTGFEADADRIDGRACRRRRASRRSFWSPPTARARRSASAPASRASAGTTASPASSPRWRMSAIITAAPRSISCRRGRSRSCRSRATARRSCGPRRSARPSASSRCRTTNSTPSWNGASACKLGEIEVVGAAPRLSARACRWRARSSPSASRWSATPRMSSIRSPGRGSIMGLRDVAALAEAIVDAARLGLDPGAPRCARALSALAAVRHRWRWASRPTGSTGCSPTAPTRCASCAMSASAWSTACRR